VEEIAEIEQEKHEGKQGVTGEWVMLCVGEEGKAEGQAGGKSERETGGGGRERWRGARGGGE
jgi:hypothetical protein